jgi:phospholipid/cholesterol/gamma-HCH transport system permease protein
MQDHQNPPRIDATTEPGRTILRASGRWTAASAATMAALLAPWEPKAASGVAFELDASGLEAFDTYGAWIIESWRRQAAAAGASVLIGGLPQRFQSLLSQIAETNIAAVVPSPAEAWPSRVLAAIGKVVAGAAETFMQLVALLGSVTAALLDTLQHPRRFRFTSTVHQIDRVAWQAVPIILLICFLIGGIIAQQGFFHFRKFGAEDYVVDMVGILVLRELGVLIVAIMVAGRSGSAYTAELGSMMMREEIDALRTMGVDPVQVLLLPRILALVIALPLLTFLGAMAALYGGGLVASLYGGMSLDIYVARLKDAISVTHFKVGMIKAPFMALAIGAVACTEGLRVKGSAESLGLQTTTSVVKSIFLVILLDGLFAMFFAAIGM